MRRTRRAGGSSAARRRSIVGGRGERRARNSPTGTRTDSSRARSSDEEAAARGGCVPDEGQRASEPAVSAWERAKRRNVRRRNVGECRRERRRKRETRTRAYLTSRRRGYRGWRERDRYRVQGASVRERTGVGLVRRMGMPIEWRGRRRGGDRRREGDWGRAKSAALDRNTAVSCARATRTAWSARKRTRRPESRT